MEHLQMQGTPSGPDAPPTPAPQVERPAWLPENFTSPEALVESYKQLQAQFTRQQQQAQAPQTPPTPAPQTPEGQEGEDTGVSFEEFVQDAMANGGLTAEHYAALEEAGYSRDVADRYYSSLQAEGQAIVAAVYETFGGEAQYGTVLQWAAANLPESAVDAYNAVVESGSKDAIQLAAAGLKAQYEAAKGTLQATRVQGGAAVGAPQGFQSWAQVQEAMADPRYRIDPAYRAQVTQALARSQNIQ